MTDMTIPAALVANIQAIADRRSQIIDANANFLAGSPDDPASVDPTGGTTGERGYYPVMMADGTPAYAPSLARVRPNGSLLTTAGFAGNGGRPAMFGDDRTFITAQAAKGNIGVSFILNNRHSPPDTDRYGVAAYFLGNAMPGASDTWAINAASFIQSGVTAESNHFAAEFDQNNSAQHYGDNPLTFTQENGIFEAAPACIVAGGPCRSTAGLILRSAGGQFLNRGFAVVGDSVAIADYMSTTNAPTVLLVAGRHQYGIDLSRATGMDTGLLLPLGAAIGLLKSDGTVSRTYETADHTMHLADGSVDCQVHCSLTPAVDNAYSFGVDGRRWSGGWFATPPATTSDPDTKTDIRPLPPARDLIMAINPASFKYKVGGQIAQEVFEDQLVQDYEDVEVEQVVTEMVDGRAVDRKATTTERRYLFDEHLVVDEAGAPVMVTIKATKAVIDPKTGEVIQPASPERIVQKIHRVPRMVTKSMPVTRWVDRPGVREHWGFLSDDHLRDTFAATGRDFAGYVVGANGERALRIDPMVAVNWKATQEVIPDVEALKGLVEALTSRVDALEKRSAA